MEEPEVYIVEKMKKAKRKDEECYKSKTLEWINEKNLILG